MPCTSLATTETPLGCAVRERCSTRRSVEYDADHDEAIYHNPENVSDENDVVLVNMSVHKPHCRRNHVENPRDEGYPARLVQDPYDARLVEGEDEAGKTDRVRNNVHREKESRRVRR